MRRILKLLCYAHYREQQAKLFSVRLPVVGAGRTAPGVKDKCFGCSDLLSASALGIPRSVYLILLGSSESISLACRNIFL